MTIENDEGEQETIDSTPEHPFYDDIKTVQGNLGHATAAFTLDVYGHVTDQMREASSMRMQAYIQEIMGQAHQ